MRGSDTWAVVGGHFLDFQNSCCESDSSKSHFGGRNNGILEDLYPSCYPFPGLSHTGQIKDLEIQHLVATLQVWFCFIASYLLIQYIYILLFSPVGSQSSLMQRERETTGQTRHRREALSSQAGLLPLLADLLPGTRLQLPG